VQVLKDEIRESICHAALAEFSEKGYEKASMRNIAKRAGITAGNMYRYFKNKDDLFYTVTSPAYDKIVRFIVEQELPRGNNREWDNLNIDKQTDGIVNIYLQHRKELLIIIDGSKGTRYERAKDDIIRLVENMISSILKLRSEADGLAMPDPHFIHVLSASVIEGVILILKQHKEDEKVREMVRRFIGFIFKDFIERM